MPIFVLFFIFLAVRTRKFWNKKTQVMTLNSPMNMKHSIVQCKQAYFT